MVSRGDARFIDLILNPKDTWYFDASVGQTVLSNPGFELGLPELHRGRQL